MQADAEIKLAVLYFQMFPKAVQDKTKCGIFVGPGHIKFSIWSLTVYCCTEGKLQAHTISELHIITMNHTAYPINGSALASNTMSYIQVA